MGAAQPRIAFQPAAWLIRPDTVGIIGIIAGILVFAPPRIGGLPAAERMQLDAPVKNLRAFRLEQQPAVVQRGVCKLQQAFGGWLQYPCIRHVVHQAPNFAYIESPAYRLAAGTTHR